MPIFCFYLLKRKRPDYYEVIFRTDKHFALEERLITFWEYRDYEDPYGLMRKLKEDLEDKLASIDLSKAYKFQPSNLLKFLSLLFVFLLILNLLYSFPRDTFKGINLVEDKKTENLEKKAKLAFQDKNKLLEEDLINKNLTKEPLSQEEIDREKIKDLERPKSLEEFLSQYNLDKSTLKKEEPKSSSNLEKKEKENSSQENNESRKTSPDVALNNNPTQGAGMNQTLSSQEKKTPQGGESERELSKDLGENLTKAPIERGFQSPVLGDGDYRKKDTSGSLPGTEERETKLGDKETERKVFSGEKIYIPPSLSEEEGKNYLFQAPTLEGRRKLTGSSLSLSPIYEKEKPVASRILPLEFQEILKIYFSQ